jgi:DNA invertase Pin-like site-specific DNA recombinase
MLPQRLNAKIRPEHLDRLAFIYVRQSTLAQVLANLGSQARQYDLVQRALDLGWPREHIQVIDQDQGHSGASAVDREGFQRLLAEVGLGHAGAVFSLEASRLARSCSDWYRLLEICALTNTLVVDEEGLYDPTQYNDRLLLGFKGTMSEAELHWLRNRLLGGKLEKAQQGRLRLPLPTGLVYDEQQQIQLDPDEQVQQALRWVFTLFEEEGTAMAVVRAFKTHHLQIPIRLEGGEQRGELSWKPLGLQHVLDILHNPAYAGAYVYGRSQKRFQPQPGGTHLAEHRTRRLKPETWTTLHREAHPGYIPWEQFLCNQQRLDDNRTDRVIDRRGAVREGSALLQGIVLCGHCGRRMTIGYLQDGTPVYKCAYAYYHCAAPLCLSLRGDGVDAAVARTFLGALQPAHLEVALAALAQLEARTQQIDQQWRLRLERARYDADLARRRFCGVDPENRLVARSLEREWNDKLAETEHLEREYTTLPKAKMLGPSPEERQRLLNLAQDLPALWQAATTTQAERKQLLRCLIKDVTLFKRETTLHIGIRWQTNALTELDLPRPQSAHERYRTSPTVIQRIRELSLGQTDSQIASQLNQEGAASGRGRPFTEEKVRWVRHRYHIATTCPDAPKACATGQRGDGRYSTRTAADLLNASDSTILRWCLAGRLDSVQTVPNGPRWIRLTPEIITTLRRPARRYPAGESSSTTT